MSNVAAGTAKKETICAAAGLTSETCAGGLTSGLISHLDLALRHTSTSDHLGFPKRSLQNSETTWPGELKKLVFWPVLGWSSVSNVAAGTAKKETICAAAGLTSETCAGGLTSGLISHLDLALRHTSTSDHLGFPKRSLQNSETAWPGELKKLVFWPVLRWSSVSNVAAGTAKKETICTAAGLTSETCAGGLTSGLFAHLDLALRHTSTSDHLGFPKRSLQNSETAWPGELKKLVFWPVLGWSSVSNVAAGTAKKETICAAAGLTSETCAVRRTSTSDWKDFPTTLPSGQRNSVAWRQGFPKRSLQNNETTWPGELKKLVFWPVLGWSSVSNVAAGTAKKETICAAAGLTSETCAGGLTSGLISHLDLALRHTSTSDHLGFPKRSLQNSETAWPGELKKLVFWPVLGWSSVSNVAAGTAKKETICTAAGLTSETCAGGLTSGLFAHLDLALRHTSTSDHLGFPKRSLQNSETAWPGELKKLVFWPVLGWSSVSNVAAGTAKKETICAAAGLTSETCAGGLTSGLISHLDLALRHTSTSDHLGFPKRSLQNSETAWPGELKKLVFWPVLGWSSVSNVAAGTAKKETICAAAGLTSETCAVRRTSTSDWKDFPTTLPSGQRNSVAWRQGFPKRSLQNNETTWPGELKKLVFWPVLGWSSVSNVAAGTAKKETICAAAGLTSETCAGGLTSGLISHLDLALRHTSTSDHLGFPKRSLQNSETAWPGELKKLVFWPVLGWSSVSNVAAGTAKKETICAAAGLTSETCAGGLTSGLISHLDLALRHTSTSDHLGFPKRSLQNSETAWPGALKKLVFWPVLGWSSVSNVAAGTAKKETICTAAGLTSETCAGGLTSGLISHLDLALRHTSTSDHLGFPKRSLQNSETAWPGELKKLVFWPVLGWSSVSNVAAGTAKKETICAAAGLTSETCAKRINTNIWITFLGGFLANAVETIVESLVDLKKRGRKTSKQHSLAGSRRPFSNHFSLTSDVKTLRLNPLKKIRFRSSFWWFSCKRNHGFGPHFLQSQRHTSLQNGLKRITGSHFWWFPCKCYRNHSRKLHGLKTGKHGLAFRYTKRRPTLALLSLLLLLLLVLLLLLLLLLFLLLFLFLFFFLFLFLFLLLRLRLRLWLLFLWFQKLFSGRAPPCRQGSADKDSCDCGCFEGGGSFWLQWASLSGSWGASSRSSIISSSFAFWCLALAWQLGERPWAFMFGSVGLECSRWIYSAWSFHLNSFYKLPTLLRKTNWLILS